MPARFGACLALLAVLGASRRAAAQTYTGPQVRAATEASIDILKDQVSLLAVQDRYGSVLSYLSGTYKLSPMRFAEADGTRSRKVAARVETMVGLGFGTTDGFGLFGGVWTDIARIGPGSQDGAWQGIAFVGAAALGFQLAYDFYLDNPFDGVDAYGNFNSGKTTAESDPGFAPAGLAAGGRSGGPKNAILVYHESGASLVVVREAKPWPESGTTVSEVRAQLQPLRQWLDKRFGLPVVAVQKLSALRGSGDMASAAADAQAPASDAAAPYEIEVGSDNLLDAGIRVRAVTRVQPDVAFRRAELAKYADVGLVTWAARAFAFERDGGVNAGVDAFAQVSVWRPGEPRREAVGFTTSAALSYSFNSPDATSFVPLPNAHVFGIQFIVGVPETAKPLVPIVRPKPAPTSEKPR